MRLFCMREIINAAHDFERKANGGHKCLKRSFVRVIFVAGASFYFAETPVVARVVC